MPIFDFRCNDCGHVFDELVKNAESTSDVACSKCGSRSADRLVSVFAATGSRSGGGGRGAEPRSTVKRGGCGPSCGCGA